MVCKRAALFRGRHFTDEIIVLCVRWYLRYSLSYRDLTEIMCELNLSIDPSTIWRWVQCYAPELNERIRRELTLSVFKLIRRLLDSYKERANDSDPCGHRALHFFAGLLSGFALSGAALLTRHSDCCCRLPLAPGTPC